MVKWPPRPTASDWSRHEWWQEQATSRQPLSCPKCAQVTRGVYSCTQKGRQVSDHCPVCAWERVVLVQEGWLGEPEVPDPSVRLPDPPAMVEQEKAKVRRKLRKELSHAFGV